MGYIKKRSNTTGSLLLLAFLMAGCVPEAGTEGFDDERADIWDEETGTRSQVIAFDVEIGAGEVMTKTIVTYGRLYIELLQQSAAEPAAIAVNDVYGEEADQPSYEYSPSNEGWNQHAVSVRNLGNQTIYGRVRIDAPDLAPFTPVDQLGEEDQEGQPYQGDWNRELPVRVDHSSLLPPARNQGRRGTCQSFAFVGAVEGKHEQKEHLSVEQFYQSHWSPGNRLPYTWRFPGTQLAREVDWRYDQEKPNDIDEKPHWELEGLISTGLDEETLKRYLAEDASNNIVVSIAWKTDDFIKFDHLYDPQLGSVEAFKIRNFCNTYDNCGGHQVLLVGYEEKLDSDQEESTFFKFKNSWGQDWGESGYGYVSSEYLRQLGRNGWLVTN